MGRQGGCAQIDYTFMSYPLISGLVDKSSTTAFV